MYSQLVKYPVVDSSNSARIVEVLRSIAELMIWGDQHNALFFDYFAEKNIITNFARIIAQRNADSKVKTQVIQTLSILIANTESEQAIFYLLSNNYINDLIVARLEFGDEDLLSQYISFLKTLSFKLNARTILFFYNERAYDFPLFVEALKFFNHQENMVRIAVRTLTLNTYKVSDPRMQKFVVERTCLPYFSNLVWFLKEQTLSMSRMIEDKTAMGSGAGVGKLDELVENMIDFMLYLQDILSLNNERMSGVLTDQLLSHYVLPVLIGSLVARYDPTKMEKAKADSKAAATPTQNSAAAGGSGAPPSSSAASTTAISNTSHSSTASSASHPPPPIPGKPVGLLASPPARDYTIQARLALYMLSVVFNCFQHYGFVNSIAIALLHPSPPVICETIVRTPIKYPFRHPKLSLTGIIFPKSLRVQPAVQSQTDESADAVAEDGGRVEEKSSAAVTGAGVGVSLSEVKDSSEKDTSKPADLLFSPRLDEQGKEQQPASTDSSQQSRSSSSVVSDADSALDFFSAPAASSNSNLSSRNSSPAPSAPPTPASAAPSENGVGTEHAALFDMFSGVAPAAAQVAAATETPSEPASSTASTPTSATTKTATAQTPTNASSTSAASPSTPTSTPKRLSGGAPSATSSSLATSLSGSSSTNSLSNLRKNFTKSANAASEKLTNIITRSKAIGAGVLQAPLGVVVSPEQYLYVMDTGHHKVQMFDSKSGKVVRRMGSKGEGDGQLMECEGIAVHPTTNHVYVADHNNHRVTVFDAKGAFLRSFGSQGSAASQFNHPTGLAFSTGTGLLYICDTHNHRVCIYDAEGGWVRAVGGKRGDADGELSEPSHVAVCQSPLDSSQDRVYVTDYGNDRVQVYDQEGKFLLKIGKTGKERGEFIAPIGAAIHADTLYIVDRGNHRVQVFDLQGGYLRSLGKRGNGGGELNEPNGVAVGSDGRVYIADTQNDRVMCFVPERAHGSSVLDHKPFTFQPLNSEAHSSAANAAASAAPADGASGNASASSTAASAASPASASASGSSTTALSQSHSTDELRNELPPDANSKARSSLPEMKVVYNPEKSIPNFNALSQLNRNKQAMLFALGSQDERVGFGAMGVLLSVMGNEAMDKQLLLDCGLCPPKLRKQEQLVSALAQDTSAHHEQDALFGNDADTIAVSRSSAKAALSGVVDILDTSKWADAVQQPQQQQAAPEVDLMAFANSSSPSSPAVIRKPAKGADSGSDEDESSESDASDSESESSEDEETDKAESESAPELGRPDTLSTTLDFFSASASSPTSKSNGLPSTSSTASAKQAASPSHKSDASSTFDILSSFPASPSSGASKSRAPNGTAGSNPSDQPSADRATSGDPLMHHKAVTVPVGHPPAQPLFPLPSSSQGDAPSSDVSLTLSGADSSSQPEYSGEVVTKLFPLPKPRQPPVRLTTLQLLASFLRELTFDPTSTRPSVLPAHIVLLRDTNRAFSDDLKVRFKNAQQGNFLLDIVDEEWQLLRQNVLPKVLVQNTRNLLTIEDRQVAGVGLEWRRGGNEWEKSRKSLQGYLLCRQLRYQLMKKKDPFYPLVSADSAASASSAFKVGSEVSSSSLASAVGVSLTHATNKPLLLHVDGDSLVLLSKADAVSDRARVELLVPIKSQEPFASAAHSSQVHVLWRAAMRPHPAARKVKAGPGLLPEGAAAGSPTIAALSGQKPLWVLGVVCSGGVEAATQVRKQLEQGRVKLRKAMMNKMCKGFEQQHEEETTSIPTAKAEAGGGAVAAGATPVPPIVPFSILNLLGDRQADIEEEDN